MIRDQGSRKLLMLSLLAAFVLGVVFGVLGVRLRPRVALAPGLPPLPNDDPSGNGPETQPVADVPRAPIASGPKDGRPDSVPGDGTTNAPEEYPVKGNQRSWIYHLPGGVAYDRTIGNVHFRTAEAAMAAGYRASKI